MLIRKAQQVAAQQMDMPGAQDVNMRVMLGRDDGVPTFAMRLFEVASGGHTPKHAHNYEHQVIVLEGTGQVLGGLHGATIRPIQPGDVVFVPPNEPHQFRNTGAGTLKFMCMVPTHFDCGRDTCAPTPGC
jgi:quercetin dioxygenase-like cupin family protein